MKVASRVKCWWQGDVDAQIIMAMSWCVSRRVNCEGAFVCGVIHVICSASSPIESTASKTRWPLYRDTWSTSWPRGCIDNTCTKEGCYGIAALIKRQDEKENAIICGKPFIVTVLISPIFYSLPHKVRSADICSHDNDRAGWGLIYAFTFCIACCWWIDLRLDMHLE